MSAVSNMAVSCVALNYWLISVQSAGSGGSQLSWCLGRWGGCFPHTAGQQSFVNAAHIGGFLLSAHVLRCRAGPFCPEVARWAVGKLERAGGRKCPSPWVGLWGCSGFLPPFEQQFFHIAQQHVLVPLPYSSCLLPWWGLGMWSSEEEAWEQFFNVSVK